MSHYGNKISFSSTNQFGEDDSALKLTNKWNLSTGGILSPTADNSYDIGTTSFKIKNIYIGGYARYTSSTLLVAPLSGTIEFDGTSFYGTNNAGVRSVLGGSSLVSEVGTNNLFGGTSAGNPAISGARNATYGIEGLDTISSGNNNTSIGYRTLKATTTGSDNTAIGAYAGVANTGSGSIFIGSNAGYLNTGSNNIFMGFYAGGASVGEVTTGSSNILIGNDTGFSTTTQYTGSVALGHSARITASNMIQLGTTGLAFGFSNRWDIASTGHINPRVNNTYDIGSTTKKIRDLYHYSTYYEPQTAPANPTTGFVVYVDSADGALKAKSSAGTVTTLAAL